MGSARKPDPFELSDPEIEVLEPRILLDAVLDLSPGGEAEDSLHVVSAALDEHVDQINQVFDELAHIASQSLGSFGNLLDPAGAGFEGGEAGAQRGAEALVSQLSEALAAATSAFDSQLGDFVEEQAQALTQALNAELRTRLNIETDLLSSGGSDLASIFSLETLRDAEGFDAFVENRLGADLADALGRGASEDELKTLSSTLLGGLLGAAENHGENLFRVELKDVVVAGNTVVAFTQNDSGVSVSVTPSALDFNISAFFDSTGLDFNFYSADGIPLELSGYKASFDLDAAADAGTFSLSVQNVGFSDFSLGGSGYRFDPQVDPAGDGVSAHLGLLSSSVTAIDTAAFDIGVAGLQSLTLTVDVELDTLEVTADLNHDPLAVKVQVQEVGGAGFSEVTADQSYELLRARMEGDFGVNIDPAQESQAFAVNLGLSNVLTSASSDLRELTADNLNLEFDVDLSGQNLSADQEASAESLVSSLAVIGGDAFAGFLDLFAAEIGAVLASDLFDIELPLTDLSFGEAFESVADTLNGITDTLSFSAQDFGFGSSVLLSRATGNLLSSDIDLSLFSGIESFDLQLIIGQQAQTVTVSATSPDGGFRSLEELAAAIQTGATASLSPELGFSVVASHGELLFSQASDQASELSIIFPSTAIKGGEPVAFDASMALGFEGQRIASVGGLSQVTLDGLDIAALNGAHSIILTLSGDGGDRHISVATVTESGEPVSLQDFANNLQTALGASGIEVTAAPYGITLELTEDAPNSLALTLASTEQRVAGTLDALAAWVQAQVQPLLPGAALSLSADGILGFELPSLGSSVDITDGAFSLLDVGVDLLGDLELRADINGTLSADVNTTLAMNLAGFASSFEGGVSEWINTQARGGTELSQAVNRLLEFVGLQDSSVNGRLALSASNISGEANLGIGGIAFGEEDPSRNLLAINAQVQATLVGHQQDGFSNFLSLNQLAEAFISGDLRQVLGRLELGGGLIADAQGNLLLDDDGQPLSQDHIFASELAADQISLIAALNFSDARLDVGGISGLTDGVLNGFTIGLPSLFDLSTAIINVDSPVAGALNGLRTGDVLDTLTSIAELLNSMTASIADELEFLGADVPVLNFSILDILDFGTEFLTQVQAFKNNPNESLGQLDSALEAVFGEDSVELLFDESRSLLNFALELGIGVSENLPLSIDLAEMLGDQLAGVIGETVADFLTDMVDARGEADLVLESNAQLNLAFGIDFSGLLGTFDTVAGLETLLAALTSTSSVNGTSDTVRPDLRITRVDRSNNEVTNIDVAVGLSETLGEAVANINHALSGQLSDGIFGSTLAGVQFDAENGQLRFIDAAAEQRDRSLGADSLFGAGVADAVEVDGALTLAGTSDLTGLDTTAAYSFELLINELGILVELPEDPARDSLQGLVEELQRVLQETRVDRSVVSPTGIGLDVFGIPLGQLLELELENGKLRMSVTNFAAVNGFAPVSVALAGVDTSLDIAYRLTNLDGSNITQLLGFNHDQLMAANEAVSEILYEGDDRSPLRAFIDTDNTSVSVDFRAGIDEGLNVVLGIGPLQGNIVDGLALVDAGDGSGAPASIRLGIADIDGDAFEGQFDLAHVGELLRGDDASLLDLLIVDAAVGIDLSLPFGDSIGLFDPEQHGLFFSSELLSTNGAVSLSELGEVGIGEIFQGALVDLFTGGSLNLDDLRLEFPDLSEFFADFNVLEVLNDPRTVLNGVDSILGSVESALDSFLGELSLPIVGGNLSSALTIFDEIRSSVLEPALAVANTPNADGSLPSSVDLLTGFLNDQLNSLLGTDGNQYIQAFLDTSGSLTESFLYGVINFSGELFNEVLDIDFDFGIPGFDMEVEEGSAITLAAAYDVYVGFGLDRNGFFLLNDTDAEEVSITFSVDANTFEGSFTVAELLQFSAVAVQSPLGLADGEFVTAPDFSAGETGLVQLVAELAVDLFGEAGIEELRDLSGITVLRAAGTADESIVSFENVVRLGDIRLSELVDIDFRAEADINLQLGAEIVNPSNGQPITVNDAAILPRVATDLVIEASFDTAADSLFNLDTFIFNDIRVDVSELYDSLIAPALDPIIEYLQPISGLLELIDIPPVSFAIDAIASAYPVLKLPLTAASIAADITQFGIDIAAADGNVVFGDFDFSPQKDRLADGSVSSSGLGLSDVNVTGSSGRVFGEFGRPNGGLVVRIPLLADPANALSLLLGDFFDVSLVELQLSLFDFEFATDYGTQIVELIDEKIDAPPGIDGTINDLLEAVLDSPAIFSANGFFGFNVGYDLNGVQGFLDSYNPLRLLDGVFIDSGDGSLVDLGFDGRYLLNLLGNPFAGAFVGIDGELGLSLGLNDPNDDGRLRIPEIVSLLEFLVDGGLDVFEDPLGLTPDDVLGFLEAVFVGDLQMQFDGIITARLNALLTTIEFEQSLFTVNLVESFGGADFAEQFVQDLDKTGGHAVLNVGSNSASSLSSINEDGDETIIVSGPASPITVEYSNDGESRRFELPEDVSSILIPAGGGDNEIDLSALLGVPTLTFTGDGTDQIRLPDSGFHVVFAGGGDDRISVSEGATGTYWIFAGDGTDQIDVLGGESMIFGADDHEMRASFLASFTNGGFSENSAIQIMEDTFAQAGLGLAQFEAGYTARSQMTAGTDADNVRLGAGSHTVYLGAGADTVSSITAASQITVYAGAGNDELRLNALTVTAEGGAGSDLIVLGDGTNTVYGWSAELNADGTTDDGDLNALARADGDDILVGGTGTDILHGQRGNNVLMGNLGDDRVFGGTGDDLITGGVFDLSDRNAASVDVEALYGGAPSALVVQLVDLNDGADSLWSGNGTNLVLGGGGNDELHGGAGSSLLVGDFAQVDVSQNGEIERLRAAGMGSGNQGADTITGGTGSDILIGGGAAVTTVRDTLTDLGSSNILIGDHADINGVRIREDATRVLSVFDTHGNSDDIHSGAGHDLVIGGERSDRIQNDGGNDLLVGDFADIELGRNGALNSLTSTGLESESQGADSILAGAGNDRIIGGAHDDTISAQAGEDLIAGDHVRLELLDKASGTLEITSLSSRLAGGDQIDSGADGDLVIAGGGNDTVHLGSGEDLATGDEARIQFVGFTDVNALELINPQIGGDDLLTADFAGDSILIGQSGHDELRGAEGDDVLIGDTAEVSFLPHGQFGLGETQAERIDFLRDIDFQFGFDDTIKGGAGRDLLLGGYGDDTLDGQSGQDLVIGDSFIIERAYVFAPADLHWPLHEELYFDTQNPYDLGGFDTLSGGDGDDIVAGGLGEDFFTGNTELDFLAGDSVALFLRGDFAPENPIATHPPANAFEAARELDVVRVNFPGLGAQDVLSVSQVNSSVGAPLEARARDYTLLPGDDSMRNLETRLAERSHQLLQALSEHTQAEGLNVLLEDLMMFDIDQALLSDMLVESLEDRIREALDGNLDPVDRYLLRQLLERIVGAALADNTATLASAA